MISPSQMLFKKQEEIASCYSKLFLFNQTLTAAYNLQSIMELYTLK